VFPICRMGTREHPVTIASIGEAFSVRRKQACVYAPTGVWRL